MKIMTGAPVPEGADAIVPYENTDRGAIDVTIRALSEYGQHIRRAGEDVAAGTVIYHGGDQLGPRDIALLAAMGHGRRDGPAAAAGGGRLDRFGAGRTGLSARVRAPDLRLELLPARRRLPSRRSTGLPGRAGSATIPSRSSK